MNKDAGRKWPIIIALSIVGIIGASVMTVKVAMNNPVEMSDYGMQSYHDYDSNANQIIEAKIAFDKHYSITFATPQISEKGTVIAYKITDKSGNPVDDAGLEVVLTRPDTTKLDISLDAPSVEGGEYTFKAVDLPKPGRWDILAKVQIKEYQRYFNLKADTRNTRTLEF